MFTKRFSFFTLIMACICAVVFAAGFVMFQINQVTGDAIGTYKFLQTLSLIQSRYDGEYDNAQLFDSAIDGMVKSLNDPYSVYLDEKGFKALSTTTEGTFGGIGVVVGEKDGSIVVVAPLEGSPGDKAGIKAGEKIIKVGDKETANMNLETVVSEIRGEKGTSLAIVLADKNGVERTVEVVRDDIKIESVTSKMLPDTKIGYIRISVFNDNTGADFRKAYGELVSEGMEATIVDLRQNPGGLLRESVKVANLLVPKGPIVSVIDKDGSKHVESSTLEAVKYPLAVLVDHGSASASEILSGAIKDTKAGKIFGVQTFGKGLVQTVYQMTKNTGLKLTTAKYYTPSGESINKIGVTPDEIVELPEDSKADTQLEAAEKYLKEVLAK